MFGFPTTIQCMDNRALTVIVSRPLRAPATPNLELRRPDFCWTADGEVLVPPPLPCADVDTCGCSWSFCGVTSAQATTWGVVERRSSNEVWDQLRAGRHVAGNSIVEGFADLTFAEILQLGTTLAKVPTGQVVGIWTLADYRYSIFDRTPQRGAVARGHSQRARR